LNEENYLADITNYTNTIKMYAIGNVETTTTLFYKKGNIQVDTMSNDNISSLKEIFIKRYQLSHDIILTDKFLKPYSDYQLISNIQTNIYICLKFNGVMIETSL
jgi:hypothetical protein